MVVAYDKIGIGGWVVGNLHVQNTTVCKLDGGEHINRIHFWIPLGFELYLADDY